MARIPETTKTQLKTPGAQFNRDPETEKVINQSLLSIATRAIGNSINDDEPYTIRINFQNGRIVGSEAQPRLSVELLNGRATTPIIDVPSKKTDIFLEFETLAIEGFQPVVNEGSWVARAKLNGITVKSVFVNRDFSEEDRELIKTVLMRGLGRQVQM